MNSRSHLITTILDILFSSEEKRLDKWVKELNQKNSDLNGRQLSGFWLRGRQFIALNGLIKEVTHLKFELMDEGGKFYGEYTTVIQDKLRIRQVLAKLLIDLTSVQDMRDALPETIIRMIPELSRLKRQKPEAFSIKDNPQDLKAYKDILPKIEYYSVIGMIN